MAKRVGNIDVVYTPMKRELENVWTEYGYEKKVLPKGWMKEEGRRPLPEAMIYEKDCPIGLRDGVKIYADVFRPISSDAKKVPAILPWSIYGKTGTGQWFIGFCPATFTEDFRQIHARQLLCTFGYSSQLDKRSREMGGSRSSGMDSARLRNCKYRCSRHLQIRR